jgi:hypothetical protein
MKLRFVRSDWYKLKMYYNQERSLQVLPNKIIQPEFENQNPKDQFVSRNPLGIYIIEKLPENGESFEILQHFSPTGKTFA